MKRITLKDKDAAIVIRADRSHESYLPKQEGNTPLLPQSQLVAMLMIALADKKAFTQLYKRFDAIMTGKSKPIPLVPPAKKEKK